MQSASLITPLLTNRIDSLIRLYKRGALKVWYAQIEILNGFNVFVHRLGSHSAIFTYSRHGKKIFKYHISVYDLNEFFAMLDFCENGEKDQQYIIGRFEFTMRCKENIILIGIEHLSHYVEIVGPRSQLKAAILAYRSLNHGLARIPKGKAYARSSTMEHH